MACVEPWAGCADKAQSYISKSPEHIVFRGLVILIGLVHAAPHDPQKQVFSRYSV